MFRVSSRKPKADAMLHGAFVHLERPVRLSARLLSVANEEHLRADSYNRTAGDVLAFQTDVANELPLRLRRSWRQRGIVLRH
jgi:TolB-like protein